MSDKVPIAEAIRELRSQLVQAMVEGEDERVRFRAKGVELELAVSFSREGGAGGKVKIFTVLEVSGDAKVNEQTTHKVKLVLEPVQPVAPDHPATRPTAGTAERRDTGKGSSLFTMAAPRVLETRGTDDGPKFKDVILRLPEHAEAQLRDAMSPDAMRYVSATSGGETGSSPQVGMIEFTDTGGAFTSALSRVMQNPDDPRHQAVTSILAESLAKHGGTQGGGDGEGLG